MNELTPAVPAGTDWLVMENNQITELAGNFEYLGNIWSLDLQGNKIEALPVTLIEQIQKGGNVQWLNLAHNKLAEIPDGIQDLTFLQRVWLSDNPFKCDCKMTWMIEWLNNFTTPLGEHIVVDYNQLICNSGLNIGDPIYRLDPVAMGCYPNRWGTLQIAGVTIGAIASVVVIVVLSVSLVRKSKSVRFFIFHKLKIRSVLYWKVNEEEEDLENMKYDAYLTYRCVFIFKFTVGSILMIKVLRLFLLFGGRGCIGIRCCSILSIICTTALLSETVKQRHFEMAFFAHEICRQNLIERPGS